MKRLSLGLFLLALATAYGQSGANADEPRYQPSAPESGKVYQFAINLTHHSLHLFEIYTPLIDYLNRNLLGARFELKSSSNCEDFERKIIEDKFDFALANPRQTLQSLRHGYHVIAKMADDPRYTGIILVRRDSGIRKVADLKGKRVAFPSPTCFRGTLLPKYYLQTHGLDVNRDIESLYVGSHESAIMNVYLGNVAAAGVKRTVWEQFQLEQPRQASALVVRWETDPQINSAVVARDDLPPQLIQQVAGLLENLNTTKQGQAILARIPLSRFEPADNRRYQAFAAFLHKMERSMLPIKVGNP
jgi:phosphonate transport system substrate-binding protein